MTPAELVTKNFVIHEYMAGEDMMRDLEHNGFEYTLHYHDNPEWLLNAVIRILDRETVSLTMNAHGTVFKEFGGIFPTTHAAGESIMTNLFNAVYDLIVLLNTNRNENRD